VSGAPWAIFNLAITSATQLRMWQPSARLRQQFRPNPVGEAGSQREGGGNRRQACREADALFTCQAGIVSVVSPRIVCRCCSATRRAAWSRLRMQGWRGLAGGVLEAARGAMNVPPG